MTFLPIQPSLLQDSFSCVCAHRAASLSGAYENWRKTGDAQPHWGRKHAQEEQDPLVVIRNNRDEGWAVAVPLCFAEHYSYASTGTYRFVDCGTYERHVPMLGTLPANDRYLAEKALRDEAKLIWSKLKQESFNGYYYLPLPNPHKQEPYVVWAQWG